MIFSQNLFRCPTPTYIVCRNWESNFSLLGPTPQLALPVEFLFEFLCVGAPPRYYLNNSFRILNNDPIN
ncbi:hypothetical protein HMPREF2658_12555 [Staphylococcus sp. HMSC062H10]|nr:hypothetical protein CKU_2425 [Staphylococcus aureus]EEV69101.1 conserved hypothetical protein [Staphylococcus aureus A9635]OHP78523.1 hypothetical protein HMPREF2658_12555 [Staphylococcus sp. HMSC062H10]PSM67763.1 hypothetical protein B9Y46_00970 [Staphylococcus aureus]PSN04547.1 hypothetical protein B9Y28_08905 [Staphylococcus aureus]